MNTLITLRLVLVPSAAILIAFPLWRRYVSKPNPKSADPIVFWGVVGIGAVLIVMVGLTEYQRYVDRLVASAGRLNPNPDLSLEPEETEPWPTTPTPPIALPLPPPAFKVADPAPGSRWWSCSW